MARAKTSTRKSNPLSDKDRYTAELSTGQLVIGVCILLMFGLACFLMGVVIGKFDPTLAPDAARQAQSVQTTPAPLERTAIARTQELPVAAPAETINAPPPEMRVPLQTEQPQAAPVAETPDTTANPPAQNQTETDLPKEVAQEPVKLAEVPPAVPAKAAQVETPTPAAPTGPSFGIQIAAFKTHDRAVVAKTDVETKTSYSAQVLPTSNGRLVRVVVGSYADKLSADQARSDLKNNYGYSDCWVVEI